MRRFSMSFAAGLVSALSLVASDRVLSAPTTLIYCSEASPRTFNPQMGMDGPTFNATSRAIYNRLVEFEKGGTTVVPSLAESWVISPDKKKITFRLRKGVKFQTRPWFQPTREFNADDVVFTVNRMLDPKHPFHKVSGGVYEFFTSMEMNRLLKAVTKVSPYEVQFELTRPETPFFANLAMDFASILSAEYGQILLEKKTPEKIDLEPVGTGPFQLVRYEKDSLIRYEAHPNFFGGRAAIDKLVFSITIDPNVRSQKLKRGECHLVAQPSLLDLPSLKQDPKLSVVEKDGLNVGYLAFNTEKKPFSDVRVRRALAMALNRESYLSAIYQGQATLATNPIPPSMWSYNPRTEPIRFDIEKARTLLKEAGLANGFETSIWYMPVSRPYNPNAKKMAEMMQADLAKLGVRAKLTTYEWGTYLDKARKGEHDMLLLGWTGDNGDPDNFLGTLLGCSAVGQGSNYARWCHKEFDQLISEAKQVSDQKARTEKYMLAQKIFRQELPWVPIAHARAFRALSKKVIGYTMSPFGHDEFFGVSMQKGSQ